MGTTMSSADGQHMQGRIRALAGSLVDLEKHVGQANEWARQCPVPTAVQLRFRMLVLREDELACACIPFTRTLEDVVKVEARKLRRHDQSLINAPQTLTVGQFYRMYCYFSDIHDCASRRRSPPPPPMGGSLGSHVDEPTDPSDSECLICMDADNEIVLPCTHSFCQRCFHSWHACHNSCPTCRRVLPIQQNAKSDDELWHLATYDSHDRAAYIHHLITQALFVLDHW
ncbi:hypothetical protein H257_17159 [Aphanomyces astaci]|uniref:RING finger protein 141 n=2 Tax=Aphanomyces astaci TaxID=112090 RepID=W4FG02_APHAT|nr:hypothetical protein H257_17159 [Aphanomyces astaci]ETV66370.1 hypothetical protein H257_17159 [Aphanomyces astaci]|eukprot:XP_009844145.1 hypothetical protein H257_17159 [Aphanomyces astaci]